MPERPPVTVVLPFYGSSAEARAALAELGRLRMRPGDAALLVDNSDDGAAAGCTAPDGVTVVASPVKRSAYGARNVGAELSTSEWLLFVDADCRVAEDLLDRYFDEPPSERAGAVAGRMTGTPDQPGLAPAYARSRGHLDQALLQRHPYRPMAVTANLLVRRATWEDVGGFHERTRSGADSDFCWRLLDAGWQLEYRHGAVATHDHRETLRALCAQARRDGAGATWLMRRYPGYRPLLGARNVLRAVLGAVAWPVLGQPRRGLFKAIDGLWGLSFDLGALESNAPPEPPPRGATLVALLDEYPAAGDPFPGALSRLAASGTSVVVEARRRPARAAWGPCRDVPARLWEDDAPLARLSARARLCARRQTLPAELGPPALRLARAATGARVLAEPDLIHTAELIVRAVRRPDLRVEPIRGREAVRA